MKSDENVIGKRKSAAAVLCLALLLGLSGCAKISEKMAPGQETSMEESEWEREEPVAAEEPEEKETGETGKPEEPEEEKAGEPVNASQETEHLGGKIQSPSEEGMTLAQTTLLDEDGMVILVDMKDAKKIPVKFTADTKVEHWTIQGGGAGIDMKEASFSDLQEGMGVELEGYFEGETFVAVKVIIEEDV